MIKLFQMNACTVHCNNVFGTSNKGAQQIKDVRLV